GLPAGASTYFWPDNLLSGAGSLAFSINAPATPGNYPITVTETTESFSALTNATLIVVVPDFAVSGPSTLSIAPSSQVNSIVTVTPAHTFNGNVALSTSGLPSGAVASFLPSTLSGSAPSTSVLNVVTTNVAPGSYPFTITGTSGATVHSIPATLVVDPAALPYPWISMGIGANSSAEWRRTRAGSFW